jgi:uncharacterized membrane protein
MDGSCSGREMSMTTSVSIGHPGATQAEVRHVPALQAVHWLNRGWEDLQHIGSAGLAHGALIAVLGGVLLMLGSSHMYLTAAAVTGYLLIAPVMSTGLCELARRRAAGESLSFDDSLQGLSRNPEALLQFGAILALYALVWFALSAILLRSVLSGPAPSLAVALWGGPGLLSTPQLLSYVACGALLAGIVFAVSVVSVPLIIDRHASAAEAMRTSLRVTLTNLPAMLVWAALIVGLTAVGFITLLVGMVVITPLLGYATWHAYRDLVG